MKITAHKPDINQNYDNPFKKKEVYPLCGIKRVLVDKDTGEIVKYLNELDSTLDEHGNPNGFDESRHDYMVKFQKFYYSRKWEGSNLKEGLSTAIPPKHIDSIPKRIRDKGFKVWPDFIDEEGHIRDYILVGMTKAVELNGQLRSVPGYKPAHTKTQAQFRDLARQGRTTEYGITDFGYVSMMQLLYKMAFQNLDSQTVLGNGWTNKTASALTGSTLGLGNRSGYLGVEGNQISLFGVEDFYGNIWENIDGIVVKDDGAYITHHMNKMGILSEYTHIPFVPLMGAEANQNIEGYVKEVERLNEPYNFPNLLGSTQSKNYTDYLWSHRKGQTNICPFGANWNNGARAGAFCLILADVASSAYSSFGARLCVKPNANKVV